MFFRGSRYAKVPGAEFIDKSGRVVRYKRIRFIPKVEASLGHMVAHGERLDHIAHQYYRDAELFWRICDANEVMRPEDLETRVGEAIRIPAASD